MASPEAADRTSPPGRLPRVGWLLGLALSFVVVTLALGAAAGKLQLPPATSATVGQVGILALTLAFFFLDGDGTDGLGLLEDWERRDWAALFGIIAAHVAISVALTAVLLSTGAGGDEPFPIEALLSTFAKFKSSTFMLLAAGLALLSGITEELLFRGYVLTRLSRTGLPSWLCVTLSAVVFGIVHLPGYGLLPSLSKAISFGLPTAIYFWRRRRLGPLIAVHVITNFSGFMAAYIAALYL